MNTRDRNQLAFFIVGLSITLGITLYGLHIFLTNVLGAKVEESLFIISATFLFALPQIIIGMMLYHKRKYSQKVTKTSESGIKRRSILSFLLDMHIFGAGMILYFLAFQELKSNGSILWIILFGLLGILSTLWMAKRSWSRNQYLISQ